MVISPRVVLDALLQISWFLWWMSSDRAPQNNIISRVSDSTPCVVQMFFVRITLACRRERTFSRCPMHTYVHRWVRDEDCASSLPYTQCRVYRWRITISNRFYQDLVLTHASRMRVQFRDHWTRHAPHCFSSMSLILPPLLVGCLISNK